MKTGLVLEGGYRKKPEAVLLTKLKYRKYPKFAKTLLNRAEDYNLCMDEILEMESWEKCSLFSHLFRWKLAEQKQTRTKSSVPTTKAWRMPGLCWGH